MVRLAKTVSAGAVSTRPPSLSKNVESGLSPAELCLHALAQIPEHMQLTLPESSETPCHLQIATAYGLGERVRVNDSSGQPRFFHGAAAISPLDLTRMTLGELAEAVAPGEGALAAPHASDSMLSGHRVVLLTNYPAHYRLPLFRLMSERLVSVGAELHVLFLAAEARARPWLAANDIEFQHEFMSSPRLPFGPRGIFVPTNLDRRLSALRPTIVLVASLSPFVGLRAARIARSLGACFGIWSGETSVMATARSRARRLARRRLLNRSDFAVVYGSRSAGYLRAMRADLPLVVGRNTAPVPDSVPSRSRESDSGAEIRLVLIGDLASNRKGVDVALEALGRTRDERLRLSVVGGGKLLSRLARDARRETRVRFLGPLPPSDVTATLSDSDALLFPTRSDIFGLVLVEAMGSRVAPIVSRAAGAVDDLAVHGHNALVVDGHDPATWAQTIEHIADDAELRIALADRARRTIETRWTMSHAVKAMIAGLRLGVIAGARGTTT